MGKHIGSRVLGWAVSTGDKPERQQGANAFISNIAPTTAFMAIYDGFDGPDGDGDHIAVYLDLRSAIELRGLLDDVVDELGGETIIDMASKAYGLGREGEQRATARRVLEALGLTEGVMFE